MFYPELKLSCHSQNVPSCCAATLLQMYRLATLPLSYKCTVLLRCHSLTNVPSCYAATLLKCTILLRCHCLTNVPSCYAATLLQMYRLAMLPLSYKCTILLCCHSLTNAATANTLIPVSLNLPIPSPVKSYIYNQPKVSPFYKYQMF